MIFKDELRLTIRSGVRSLHMVCVRKSRTKNSRKNETLERLIVFRKDRYMFDPLTTFLADP